MHEAFQFVIGFLLGFAAWRTVKRSPINLDDHTTRGQALAVLGGFALLAGLALGIADVLSR